MQACICGTMLDLKSVPNNSRATSLPGKHCPVCNEPLDELALESSPARCGSSNSGRMTAAAVHASRRERLGLDEGEHAAAPAPRKRAK